MCHSLLVRGFQSPGDLQRHVNRLLERQRIFIEPLSQSRTLDQLQHQASNAFGFFKAVNRCDVGMIDGGQHLGFPLETHHPVRIFAEGFGQDLQRDITVESHVSGPDRRRPLSPLQACR